MKIWNFGIIGAGLIADFHAKAIQHLENARLIGICSTNPGKAAALAGKYNCKTFKESGELLNSDEIEIVTIATPSGAHMEPTIEAALHGKHVLCEKPIEISLGRIDKMIEAHAKAGTTLGSIFNYRYNDSFKSLKSAIDKERFGTITYASVHVPWWRSDDYYKDSWHGTLKLDGGGALMNQAIHMIDILQHLMGPVDSLDTYTAALGHSIEVEDTAAAVLRFKNNALGVIYGSTASFPGQFRRLEITGTKGTVIQVEIVLRFGNLLIKQRLTMKFLTGSNKLMGEEVYQTPVIYLLNPMQEISLPLLSQLRAVKRLKLMVLKHEKLLRLFSLFTPLQGRENVLLYEILKVMTKKFFFYF